MMLFNFKTWEKISTVQHERSKRWSLNEQEIRRRFRRGQYAPEDYTDKQLEELTESIQNNVRYAIGNIVRQQPFFSEAAIKLKYIYTYDVKTAATDGRHMFINPAFFEGMSRKAIEFIVLHEILHCMLFHFLRKQGRDHTLWNYATDFEINLICKEELNYDPLQDPALHDPETGEGILYDEQYKGKGAEEIYEIMPYKKIKINFPSCKSGNCKTPGQNQGQPGSGQGQPGEEQPGQGQPGQGQPGQGLDQEDDQSQMGGGGEMGQEDDQKNPGGGSSIGEVISPEEGDAICKREGVKTNEEINNRTTADWDKLFKEGARKRAQRQGGTHGVGGILDDIIREKLQPKINWQFILKRFIGNAISSIERLRLPSKRWVPKGVYRSKEKQSTDALQNVICAIDTSGSMLPFVPPLFFEIEGILKSQRVNSMHVLYFDTKVDDAEILKRGQKPDMDRITGGGGTLFMPVIDWINENARNTPLVIIMSDGDNADQPEFYEQSPAWRNKCVWIIVDNPSWKEPFGKVIHISGEQLISET